MNIKILGSGCNNCETLEAVTRQAVAELGLVAEFEKVTDPGEIASWGVMRTPALVVDDQLLLSGRVPSKEDVVGLLS